MRWKTSPTVDLTYILMASHEHKLRIGLPQNSPFGKELETQPKW